MTGRTKTVFFSVGEPSGDQHAARLIDQWQARQTFGRGDSPPQSPGGSLLCRGFGGPEMQRAGCHLDLQLTDHAVVGLMNVLPKLRDFFRFADQAEAIFASGGVDAVVLVDFPGFNWHIAKRAKRYGIPVHYYCPPQLWAWGRWRLRKMRRLVDHVIAVLPFERDFFADAGIPTTYVGHPFFDAVHEQLLDPAVMNPLKRVRTVAVLPGSRNHEVRDNFPLMLEAIRRLCRRGVVDGSTRFAVAAFRDKHCLWCRDQLSDADRNLPIDFYAGKTSEIIQAAHCGMMVSGSVSLEMMARGTPAAVIYRTGRVLHAVGRRVVKIDTMTLPNLMTPQKVFPEFVSVGDREPGIEFLRRSLTAMLGDAYYHGGLQRTLGQIAGACARPGASRRAADVIAGRVCGSELPARKATGETQTERPIAA